MDDVNKIKVGMKVRVSKLEDTQGMLIAKKHLDLREAGKTGQITGYVLGHGGDVWWVAQDNGIAAYSFTELEEISA